MRTRLRIGRGSGFWVYGMAALGSLLIVPNLWAGMPSPAGLTDLGTARISAISFFVVVFLVASFVFWLIWNFLRKDFPSFPKLTYLRAVAFVATWATAFFLILTMIAGARELMTPGAWKKNGAIYELDDKR